MKPEPERPTGDTAPQEEPGTCPFCGGRETELASAFGSHASVSTYWCRRCRSPFEVFKWRQQVSGSRRPPATP